MEKVTLERLSFRRNFLWSFAGNMFYSGCLWIMLMAMTKLLQVEKVGMFILATAIVTPIQYLTNMYLGGVMASDAKNKHKFGECFALRIVTVALMAISAITISIFLGKRVEMILIMAGVVLYKSADCYADITYGLLQKYERLDKVALSRFIRGAAGCLVFVMLIFITRKLLPAFAGVATVWAIIFVLLDLPTARRFEKTRPIFDAESLKKLTILSAPLGVTMAITSFNAGIPRYFTEKYLGSAQLGYFGSLAYIIALFRIAISAMSVSALPRLSRYYIENIRGYLKLLAKLVTVAAFIGLSGVILGFLLGSRFIAVVYTADYAKYKTLFLWLLTAGGVQYVSTMLCYGLTSARLFKVQVPLFAIVTLVTVLVSWALIPRFGVIGAAWAMISGSLTSGFGALAIISWNIAFHKGTICMEEEKLRY